MGWVKSKDNIFEKRWDLEHMIPKQEKSFCSIWKAEYYTHFGGK